MATEGTTSSATSPSQHPEPPKKLSDKDFNFHYDRILGEGSFSTVMVGTERRSGVQWAIKSLVIKQLLRDNMQEYAFRERDALNLLNTRPWDPSTLAKSDKSDPADITEDLDPSSKREGAAQTPTKSRKMEPHPFFVRLHASFKSHERLFYVLTYARNGEILDYVKRMGSLPLHVARFYLAEIVSAVHHLHRYGIIHRDLKPENILLGDAMHILLTDFGSCKILKSTSTNATTSAASNESRVSTSRQPEAGSPPRPIYGPVPPPNHPATYIAARGAAQAGRGMRRRANSFVGTAQYVSPEMLQGRPEEKASDLWALGCILYHFIAGSFPFKGTSQYHIFQKIQALDFDYPEEFDEVAKDLTSKLIVLDPEKRLGADASGGISALVRHPFLADVDFETLHLQKAPLSPTDRLAAGAAASESSGTEDPNLEDGFNEEDFARAVMLKLDDDDDETFLSDGDQNGKNESPSAAPANGAIPIPTRGKSCVIPASQSSSAVSNGSVPVNHPYSSSSSSACASPSSVSSSAENKQLANYLAPESMTGSGSFSRLPSTTAWTAVSMVGTKALLSYCPIVLIRFLVHDGIIFHCRIFTITFILSIGVQG